MLYGKKQWLDSQYGGVALRILWIAATLVIVSIAIYWFLDKGQQNQEVLNRKATEISEYGLLIALERLKDNPSRTSEIAKTEYEGGWYTATLKRLSSNDTVFLAVESIGHAGSVSKKQACTLRLEINGADSVWIRQSIK